MRRSNGELTRAACLGFALALHAALALADRHGYESLANWSNLPDAKPCVAAHLASSYDRSGANRDYNHYLLPEGFQNTDGGTVVTELSGPRSVRWPDRRGS